jgi:hypothetical protein
LCLWVFLAVLGDVSQGSEKEEKVREDADRRRGKTEVKEGREASRCYQSVSERVEVNQHLLFPPNPFSLLYPSACSILA